MKLTPWFHASVKPTRHGVYQVCCLAWPNGSDEYAYFGIAGWGWAHNTPKAANRYRKVAGATQAKSWRGLASEDGK